MVASLVGGAILLFSCGGKKSVAEADAETMITQQSDTLTMVYTKNGRKDYRFSTPLMERYELARDPYMEFRYGINVITFDSLGAESSSIDADYAIFYEKRELWEARGNVVASGEGGRTLYTQQLFWDQKTDKVYSNVDCKIVDGEDTFFGEGFDSDSKFTAWVFRNNEGRLWVDTSEQQGAETLPAGSDNTAKIAAPQKAVAPSPEKVTPANPDAKRVDVETPRRKSMKKLSGEKRELLLPKTIDGEFEKPDISDPDGKAAEIRQPKR